MALLFCMILRQAPKEEVDAVFDEYAALQKLLPRLSPGDAKMEKKLFQNIFLGDVNNNGSR